MNRLRYSDIKADIAEALNVCSSDSKVLTLTNEAHQRLVNKGKWVGTLLTYRICVGTDSCLVWPRQIETIEAWALCHSPGMLRNRWYEFNSQGPGIIKHDQNWFTTMIDKDPVVAFDEISNNSSLKRIQVTADVTEAAGLKILLQGYDQNANWIRTLVGGVWIDGEQVTISTTAQLTTNYFTTLTGVQKPVTNGPVRLAEYTTTVIKQLAYYESDEQVPIYRKSFLPGMENMTGCDDSSDCESKSVTVIAKLRHIDVRGDNDWLLLGNRSAIRLMAQAILKEKRNLLAEAAGYEAQATRLLQEELSSYEGDGALPMLKQEGRDTWGPGIMTPVDYNFINWY